MFHLLSLMYRLKILKNNIQRVSDALALVNGVVYQDSYGGGFWDNYSFRGLVLTLTWEQTIYVMV